MKTTNFENSKELHKLGFNSTSIFGWFSKPMVSPMELAVKWIVTDGIKEGFNFDFYSFDLETLLEALPEKFYLKEVEDDFHNEKDLSRTFFSKEETIGYDFYCNIGDYVGIDGNFSFKRKENESLADTAARLLIRLVEKGIINFKGE